MTEEEAEVERILTTIYHPEQVPQLVALGPAAVEALIQAMERAEADDWGRILNAAIALGEIGDPRAVKPLIAAAGRSEWIRPRILSILTRFEGDQARRTVSNAAEAYLADPSHADRGRRRDAAQALGMLHYRNALQPLMAAASDPDRGVCLASATAIAGIGGPEAEAFLLEKVRSPNATDRRDGIEGLAVLGPFPTRLSILTTLLLQDRHPAIRQTAAWALRRVGDETVRDALEAAQEDEQSFVREAAREALRVIEGRRRG